VAKNVVVVVAAYRWPPACSPPLDRAV